MNWIYGAISYVTVYIFSKMKAHALIHMEGLCLYDAKTITGECLFKDFKALYWLFSSVYYGNST